MNSFGAAVFPDPLHREKTAFSSQVFHKFGVLSDSAVRLGLSRLVQAVDDLSLDVPRASAVVARFLLVAKAQGVIGADFFDRIQEIPRSPRGNASSTYNAEGMAASFTQKLFRMYAEDFELDLDKQDEVQVPIDELKREIADVVSATRPS